MDRGINPLSTLGSPQWREALTLCQPLGVLPQWREALTSIIPWESSVERGIKPYKPLGVLPQWTEALTLYQPMGILSGERH